MSGQQSNNIMSSSECPNQLIAPSEIKQEPDIKEEPIPTGDLVEFPAILNDGISQISDNLGRYNDKSDHVHLPLNAIKSEVRAECVEKKKKKGSKANKRNADAMDKRKEQHSSGRAARNVKKPNKSNAQGNSSKQHQCDECGYSSTGMFGLERHLLTHTNEKPFPCSHCHKEFTRKQYLQNHMKMHVEEFLFSCAVCLKGFNDKNEKVEHEKKCSIHRYECHLCKQSFGSNKADLIRHIRIHSGAKPFECKKCSNQFTLKGNLKTHMKLHAGQSSFHCARCRQGFVQQDERLAHEQKCSRRVYECYVCGRSFGLQKGHFDQHMCTHTGDKPFQCHQCPMKFAQKGDLNKHMKIHSRSLPWKCGVCRQGFPKQNQCKAHQQSCSRRVYECCLCRKFIGSSKTDLKRHMSKHTGKKPFRCEMCRGQFARESYLCRHINRVHMIKH